MHRRLLSLLLYSCIATKWLLCMYCVSYRYTPYSPPIPVQCASVLLCITAHSLNKDNMLTYNGILHPSTFPTPSRFAAEACCAKRRSKTLDGNDTYSFSPCFIPTIPIPQPKKRKKEEEKKKTLHRYRASSTLITPHFPLRRTNILL